MTATRYGGSCWGDGNVWDANSGVQHQKYKKKKKPLNCVLLNDEVFYMNYISIIIF